MLNPDAVTEVLGLQNRGEEVFYGMDKKATKFMNNLYGLGSAPKITTFCKMIEDMQGKADDNFMRDWIVLTVTCFLCPTTSICVSPRYYPMVVDLEKVKTLSFAKFVHDRIMSVVSNKGTKKKSVSCCVHHLVVKYVDSLVVDFSVPNCKVRVHTWGNKRIAKVIKAEKKPGCVFGGFRVKPSVLQQTRGSLFVDYEEDGRFVSSKLPSNYNPSKKRKLTAMASELCKLMSDQLATFIEGAEKINDQVEVDRPNKKLKQVTFAVPSSVSNNTDISGRHGVKRRGHHIEDDDDNEFFSPVRLGSNKVS